MIKDHLRENSTKHMYRLAIGIHLYLCSEGVISQGGELDLRHDAGARECLQRRGHEQLYDTQ